MRVELSPVSVSHDENLSVELLDANQPLPQAVILGFDDDIEEGWFGEVGLVADEGGALKGEVAVGLVQQAAVYAVAVRLEDGATVPVVSNMVGVNAADPAIEPPALRAQLMAAREARFGQPLGDPKAEGVIEHRVVCVVERLLMTRQLDLPGITVLPVQAQPDGLEQLELLNSVLDGLGWVGNLPADFWTRSIRSNRPWTAIVCRQVWATDFNEAARLAWEQRSRLLAIFGLARGARGRPVATVVQQRKPDDSITWRCFVEDERYTGNLLGGFVSGEDPRSLLINALAMEANPLLELLVDLYSEALADRSRDAQYLRWWSILETLSDARVQPDQPVQLLDGNPYPDGGHTGQAAPRVYQFLADTFKGGQIDEHSTVTPAQDLYEAVRAWYGRRNATGHYGRFDPSDSRQQAQGWMKWASLTEPSEPGNDWLDTLKRVVEFALHRELSRVGRELV